MITRTYFDGLNMPIITVQNLTGRTIENSSPPPFDPTNPDQNLRIETIFDEAGNPTATIDPLGTITRTYFDALNRPKSIVQNLTGQPVNEPTPPAYDPSYPDRNVRQDLSYDPRSNLVETTDALGRVSHFEYDQLYRRTTTVKNYQPGEPEDAETNIRAEVIFDAAGNLLRAIDPNQHSTTYEHDGLYRRTTVTDPNGITSSTVYDAQGNAIETSNGLGHRTTYQLDALGRLLTRLDPLGNEFHSAYDRVGNRKTIENGNGIITYFEYDGLNRLVIVTENYRPGFEPDQETDINTTYEYDGIGNKLTTIDGQSNETTFGFDEIYRLISKGDPLGNTTSYTYNAAGNQIGLVDAEEFTTLLEYDDLHRLTGINYPDPDADVSYVINGSGSLVSMIDGVGTTSWAYDSLDRPISITDPFGRTVEYLYDAVGNRTSMIYPDGNRVDYQFDPGNRLRKVIDWDLNVTTYNYNRANQIASAVLPNGVTSSYSYDAAGNLSYVSHVTDEGPLATYEYTYDAVGNRTKLIESILQPDETPGWAYKVYLPNIFSPGDGSGEDVFWNPPAIVGSTPTATITYEYDPLNRLISSDYNTGEFFHYTYDPLGNRLSQETLAGIDSYLYDDASRISEVNGISYDWDSKGNLLSDGESTFTYDHANRLTAFNEGGIDYGFSYNGLNDRLEQTIDGLATSYVVDLNAPVTQVISDSTNAYLYGLGRIGEEQPNGWQYHLSDALTSVRQLSNSDGAITSVNSFEPYGDILNSAGDSASIYGFTGEVHDSTGLVYLRARYLEPNSGRFISMDTHEGYEALPQTLNKYAYGLSNPITLTDPSGEDPISKCLVALGTLAVVDGFLLVGDAAGLGVCGLILLSAGISSLVSMYYAGDVADVLEDACTLPRVHERIYNDERIEGEYGPIIWQRPVPEPAPKPEPESTPSATDPPPPPIPSETPRPPCDPVEFTDWWWSLDQVAKRPAYDWYQYEQRVARANGWYGAYTRRVPTGPIDADGIQPQTCRFIEAKYSRDPKTTFYRPNGPAFALSETVKEFRKYLNAVMIPNGRPRAQPRGLLVRTSFTVSTPFFQQALSQAGFILGVNGFIEVFP
jgi:RHS repeat-associated protein